jgi:hypothetical protein
MNEVCQSFRRDSQVCRDGFIQKPFCWGKGGCFSCGHISERALPDCLRDEIAPHLLRDDGSPLFYQRPE